MKTYPESFISVLEVQDLGNDEIVWHTIWLCALERDCCAVSRIVDFATIGMAIGHVSGSSSHGEVSGKVQRPSVPQMSTSWFAGGELRTWSKMFGCEEADTSHIRKGKR